MFNFLHRYQLQIIQSLLIGLCPCVFFVPRAAVIFIGLGGSFGWLKQKTMPLNLLKHPLSLTTIALIGWNSLSAFWSFNSFETLILSFRLAGLLAFSLGWISWLSTLDNPSLLALKRSFFYGVICALALLSLDHFLNNPWQNYISKSSAKAFVPLALTISISIWPCIEIIKKDNFILKISFIVFVTKILSWIDCDTSILAVLAGIAAYICYLYLPNLILKMIKILGVTFMMIIPWLFSNFLTFDRIQQVNQNIHSVSYIHRLYVWEFVSQKICDHWMKGYGGESSRNELVGGKLQNWSMTNKIGEAIHIRSKSIPLHPHNLPLQLWLELGILGAILGAIFYYLLLNQIIILSVQSPALISLFIAANIVFWINLGCWQSWWLASLCFIWPLTYFPNSVQLPKSC